MTGADQAPLLPEGGRLLGKRVLVTGGTTGVGRAVARILTDRGARVLIFGRDDAVLDDALAELRRAGGDAHGLTADVSRLDDVRRVFAAVDENLGGLDILVNNAAVTGDDFTEDSLETIEYVVRTNIVGYLVCAHEAVARFREGAGGHVVLVGSMSADLREPGGSTYVATKAAIQGFAESLRKTVADDAIKVTLIEPGKIATDLVDQTDPEMRRRIEELEMLMPEDVAGSILYALLQPERCDVVSIQLRPHRQVI